MRPHVFPEEKFPRKTEGESGQDTSVLFLLLGLLFVDLFLGLGLFRVALLRDGERFSRNHGLGRRPCRVRTAPFSPHR